MGRTIQLIRGTTAQNDNYTGPEGSLTYDNERNSLRLHNGTTSGGEEIIPIEGITPDYSHAINLAPGDLTPDIGWIFFNIEHSGTNMYIQCTINGVIVHRTGWSNTVWMNCTSWLLVRKGISYSLTGSGKVQNNRTKFFYLMNRR